MILHEKIFFVYKKQDVSVEATNSTEKHPTCNTLLQKLSSPVRGQIFFSCRKLWWPTQPSIHSVAGCCLSGQTAEARR